ncbi:MAG: AAA family ATPase [Thiotrichales bacterium]|nr:AAA family ATPase [Thiotrichales bacterium]
MSEPTRATREDVEQASAQAEVIRAEIAKAVVGQIDIVEQVLVGLFAGGHALIEGVPGLGKTLLVKALSRTFNGSFARIQFTPDLMPADITGHAMFEQQSGQFRIRRGPVFTNLLLADEINRAPAKTQAALLEVMQERQVTIEGKALELSPPFMTLATQNPIESEGTYPLPEAQLDRFLVKLLIEYPTGRDENTLVKAVTSGQVGDTLNVSSVSQVIDPAGVQRIQAIVSTLMVDERVNDYAVAIVRKTREWPGVAVGAGPRGGIALIRAARAQALLAGREFVTPDDVKRVARPCLRHRLTLSPELEIEGHSTDEILGAILGGVDAPRT